MFNWSKVQEFKVLRFKGFGLFWVFVFSLLTAHFSLFTVSYAAHPLVTDDTGTQGKGKFQIEVNSEFSYEKEQQYNADDDRWETKKDTGGEIATVFTFGVIDNLDIFIEAPYKWKKTKVDGVVTTDPTEQGDGISDIAI